jgi:hypothetical protein
MKDKRHRQLTVRLFPHTLREIATIMLFRRDLDCVPKSLYLRLHLLQYMMTGVMSAR